MALFSTSLGFVPQLNLPRFMRATRLGDPAVQGAVFGEGESFHLL